MHFQSLQQIEPTSTEWLWPHRLGLGKLALLDGDPGLGKSLVTLDLCARLSTGRPFPDGSPGPGVGSALVLNAEDRAADTIRPRLQALGANLELVYVPSLAEAGALLTLPSQTRALDAALEQTHARLVVIDPLPAFLDPGVVTGIDALAQRALAPLAQLAEHHRCAVLMVRHLTKQGGRRAIYRGGGAIGLVGACRSAWLVGPDPHQPGRRLLAEVKNNLAAPQPSLAYEVVAAPDAPPVIAWQGISPVTADQVVAPVPTNPLPRDRATEFLSDFLRDEPRTCRVIWTAARRIGLSERTLRRAKHKLEIRSARVWAEGKRLSYWLLPHQELPAEETGPPDLEPWLKPLREQFPSPSPLENL